jgi:hypothetical protein
MRLSKLEVARRAGTAWATRRVVGLVAAIALLGGASACREPDRDNDAVGESKDCDEDDPTVYPGAPELCDGIDNNCNDEIDERPVNAPQWFFDRDADNFGDSNLWERSCEPKAAGWVQVAGDCDDYDGTAFPGGTEVCDKADNDCDGAVDEGSESAFPWYADVDGDGFGDPASLLYACSRPDGYVEDNADCDDRRVEAFPGADETCNDEDDDCDGATDEAGAIDGTPIYDDKDGDGYGDPASERTVCDVPSGAILVGDDCDDRSTQIRAGCSCSDFSEGDLTVKAGETKTIESGIRNFEKVVVESGGTLTIRGTEPAMIHARSINIAGTVDVRGSDGKGSGSGSTGDGGSAGPGGGGGGGGGDCGNGAGRPGTPNGGTPSGTARFQSGGVGGLGFGITAQAAAGGFASSGGGGGGGGHERNGRDGGAASSSGGLGGFGYGSLDLLTDFAGGAGGAGGATNGGGGGGGGGALQLFAADIDVSGTIVADGGNGGVKNAGGCTAGGGGGGAGGSIWIHGDRVRVTGTVTAIGGRGGSGGVTTNSGGGGSDGRIRISGLSKTVEPKRMVPRAYEDGVAPLCPLEESDAD